MANQQTQGLKGTSANNLQKEMGREIERWSAGAIAERGREKANGGQTWTLRGCATPNDPEGPRDWYLEHRDLASGGVGVGASMNDALQAAGG